ncbi:MAG: methyl-accepting chemotaxis protein [Magnetococcales bacterium]|nr:methyl-accepting chemotaxis protein [Magnetococcales bacterium]
MLGAPCVGCLSKVLEEFSGRFERSAKRWELVVYPSLFAFTVLAIYGFFLIYSLTSDMRSMATAMDPRMGQNMATLSGNMQQIAMGMNRMTESVSGMSEDVRSMRTEVQQMNRHVAGMDQKMGQVSGKMDLMSRQMNTLEPIVINMHEMNRSMLFMTGTVANMGRDMNTLARPMEFMNTFIPMR